MKGEFDRPSKPATDEYRSNWDRAFGRRTGKMEISRREQEEIRQESSTYPNGCPILTDERMPKEAIAFVSSGRLVGAITNIGPQKDDL